MFTAKNYEQFFKKLHNLLRDGESSLTGMAALNEINNFILLIFIEPRIDEFFGKGNDNLKFSYLCTLVDEYNKYKICKTQDEKIKRDDIMNNILNTFTNIVIEYCKNKYIKKYIDTDSTRMTVFHNQRILQNKEDVEKIYNIKLTFISILEECRNFIFNGKEINKENIKLVLENMDSDVIGDAYENFKEQEVGNQGKTMGQYFSPRVIIKYCIQNYIKPKYNETCYDSSVGTGGFLHYMNKFVRENSTKEQHKQYRYNCIYANDKTEDLMKPLYINLLLHDIGIDNIHNRNSLSFKNCKEYLEKFDNFVGNPPYGLKHKAKYDKYDIYINDNSYNYFPKFMKTGSELIKDSMGQFMIHCINSLKVGGKFSLIIDRGILNNGTENKSWQKQLRKWLLCNVDLQQIVLLPKGIFATTNFDTAIICGVKKVPFIDYNNNQLHTDKVNVFIGKFEDEKNKTGLIVKNKPDMVWKNKDIINNDFSLKYDDYVEKENLSYNGIMYKSLGEVCEFKFGTRITKSKDKGDKYPVYGGGDITFYTNKYNLDENTLVISRFGVSPKCVRLINHKCWLNDSGLYIQNYKNIKKVYLDLFLLINQNRIFKYSSGQAQKNMETNKLFRELKIPILSDDHQQEIVEFMDNVIGDDYSLLDRLVQEFKDIDLFKFLLVKEYDTMEYAIIYIKDLIRYETTLKRIYEIEKKFCFKMIKAEYKTLGDVCEFVNGKILAKNNIIKGQYPVIGGGKQPFGYHNKYNTDENTILCSKSGAYAGYISSYNEKVWMSDCFGIYPKEQLNKKYLYYYLQCIQNNIYKSQTGNAQPHYSITEIVKIKIPVPSLEDQEKIIKQIEAIEEKDSDYHKALEGMKQLIMMVENSIEMTIDKDEQQTEQDNEQQIEQDNEQQDNEQHNDEQSSSDSDDEYEYVERKGIKYILDDTKVYKINKKGFRGKLYGNYINGKVKKIKKDKDKVL